jgi:hypothetical protein
MRTRTRTSPGRDVLSLTPEYREGRPFSKVERELAWWGDIDEDGDGVDAGEDVADEGVPEGGGEEEEEEAGDLEEGDEAAVSDGNEDEVAKDGVGRLDGFFRVWVGFLERAKGGVKSRRKGRGFCVSSR